MTSKKAVKLKNLITVREYKDKYYPHHTVQAFSDMFLRANNEPVSKELMSHYFRRLLIEDTKSSARIVNVAFLAEKKS